MLNDQHTCGAAQLVFNNCHEELCSVGQNQCNLNQLKSFDSDFNQHYRPWEACYLCNELPAAYNVG